MILNSFAILMCGISILFICKTLYIARKRMCDIERSILKLERLIDGIRNPLIAPMKMVSREDFEKMYPSDKEE